MATMTISLPEPMKDFIDAQVAAGLYADVSDYIRDLVRADLAEEGGWEIDEALGAALDAGEASGWSEKSPAEILAEERAKYRSG